MGAIASQITSLTIVYSIVYSDTDQRKHQSSASLAFVRGIHQGLVNSPHKWPVTRKMFPFDDVIMNYANTVTADAMVPCVAKSSAAMVLSRRDKCVLVFQGEWFQLPVPLQGLYSLTRLILVLCQANERRRYKVTPPLIGWAQTYDQPWLRWHRLIGIRIPIINMRRSSDRLMFIMGIPIPARRRFF